MAESLTCPACQESLKVKAIPPPGTNVQCFKCKQVFAVPGEKPKPKLKLKVPAPAPAPQADDLFGGASDDLFSADPFGSAAGAQPLGGGFASGPAMSPHMQQAQPQYAASDDEPTHPAVFWATILGGGIGAIVLIGLLISSFMHMNRKEQPVVAAAPVAATPAAKVAPAGTTPGVTVPVAAVPAAVPAVSVPVPSPVVPGNVIPAANVPVVEANQSLLRYKWQPNVPVVYEIDVGAELPMGSFTAKGSMALTPAILTETDAGLYQNNPKPNLDLKLTSDFEMKSLTNGGVVLDASVLPEDKRRKITEAAVSASGKLHFPIANSTTADRSMLIGIVDALPDASEAEWYASFDTDPTSLGKIPGVVFTQNYTYTLGEKNGNRQKIQKRFEVAERVIGGVQMSMRGEGWFVFDTEIGQTVEGELNTSAMTNILASGETWMMKSTMKYRLASVGGNPVAVPNSVPDMGVPAAPPGTVPEPSALSVPQPSVPQPSQP